MVNIPVINGVWAQPKPWFLEPGVLLGCSQLGNWGLCCAQPTIRHMGHGSVQLAL